MRAIYGMAKCYLDLGGSRSRNFELDYLRLALVAERDPTCEAVYLAAPLRKDSNRIEAWKQKYAGSKKVVFVHLLLRPEELKLLEAEKAQQNVSNRNEADKETKAGATASYGQNLCEDKLAEYVKSKHPSVHQRKFENAPCLSAIRWDYFGVVAD